MSDGIAFDVDVFLGEVGLLKKLVAKSPNRCWVAKLIAVQNQEVLELIKEKARSYIAKGVVCEDRADGKVAVVFEFECRPGQLCLVKPSFAAVVDLEYSKVEGIIDPYNLEIRISNEIAKKPCPCKGSKAEAESAAGCDTEASVSLRKVRIENWAIKGEVWARLKVKCAGVGTFLDFDDKLFDFEIDRNGGSIEKELDVGCAHLVLKVYAKLDPAVCIHWDITGCKVKVLGQTLFNGFDEHGENCLSV